MNCYQAKAGELAKQWYVIDANEAVVGRLAAQIAPILMGKHRPTYTPHIDTGDYVIVTNVDKVVFTGNKWQQEDSLPAPTPGPPRRPEGRAGLEALPAPSRPNLRLAIQRMMPKNKIGRHMMSKLKLYAGPVHEHQAQSPIPLEAIHGRPSAAGAIYVLKQAPKAPGSRTVRRKAVAKSFEPRRRTPVAGRPPSAHEAQRRLPPPRRPSRRRPKLRPASETRRRGDPPAR